MAEPIQFYFDQHIPSAVAVGVRQHGVDVVTAQEVGRCGLLDPDQLAFAAAEERVVVTFDSDYIVLHDAGVQHAGIAWTPATKYSIGQLVKMLVMLHAVTDRDGMRNRLEYL